MKHVTPALRPLALVTGAGSLLGHDLALHLAGKGCDLLLADADGESLLALREELAGRASQVQLFQGNMARAEQRRELLHFLRLAGVKPDIFCFQAASQLRERRLSATSAEVRAQVEAGLLALDDLLRGGLLADMLREGNGYVLVALRREALAVRSGAAVSSGLGAGLARYLEALHQELVGSGVSITCCLVGTEGAQLLPSNRSTPATGAGSRTLATRALKALFARRFWVNAPFWTRCRLG